MNGSNIRTGKAIRLVLSNGTVASFVHKLLGQPASNDTPQSNGQKHNGVYQYWLSDGKAIQRKHRIIGYVGICI